MSALKRLARGTSVYLPHCSCVFYSRKRENIRGK